MADEVETEARHLQLALAAQELHGARAQLEDANGESVIFGRRHAAEIEEGVLVGAEPEPQLAIQRRLDEARERYGEAMKNWHKLTAPPPSKPEQDATEMTTDELVVAIDVMRQLVAAEESTDGKIAYEKIGPDKFLVAR